MAEWTVRESGTATAEFAVAVPAVVLVLALGLTGLRVAVDQVRAVDAARAAVRVTVRGEGAEAGRETALGLSPPGTQVQVTVTGTEVVAEVRPPVPAILAPVGQALDGARVVGELEAARAGP